MTDAVSTSPVPLIVREYSVTYRQGKFSIPAVKELSFELKKGEIIGVVGESGAGKSTIGWGLLGMIDKPHVVVGQMLCDGQDVVTMNPRQLFDHRWKKVAMIFQSAMNSLDPVISIGKNFTQVLRDKDVIADKAESQERIAELMQMVGLNTAVADMYPFELSGGMKQRVSIAMALGANPQILVADEPTTALDTITQFSILGLLLNLRAQKKIGSMILISHDLSVQAFMVDRAMVMLKGRVVELGSKSEIFKDPKHPYTQFLISSLNLGKEGTLGRQQVKKSGAGSPSGCPFAHFCPYVMDKCLVEFPKNTQLSATRSVACYLYGG